MKTRWFRRGWQLLMTAGLAALCLLVPAQAQQMETVVANVETVHEDAENYYTDLIRVSVSIPGREAVAWQINQTLEEAIYSEELGFRDSMLEMIDEGAVVYGPYSVTAELADLSVTDRILSVNVRVSFYAGGPHPWGYYVTANVDMENGQLLCLSDLFSYENVWPALTQVFYSTITTFPSATNLFFTEDLYSVAKREVQRLEDEDPVSGWTLTGSGLTFYYGGGTLAIYAAGDIEIPISLQQLYSLAVRSEYVAQGHVNLQQQNSSSSQAGLEPVNPSGPSGGGYTGYDNGYDASRHSYQLIYSDATWEQAYTMAQNQGGHLVTITCEQEQQIVQQLLSQYQGLRAVWIGGRRESGQNTFYWTNGEAMNYQMWGPGEPNNETGDEDYMDMYPKNGVWVWNDVPLSISRYYSGAMGYILETEW